MKRKNSSALKLLRQIEVSFLLIMWSVFWFIVSATNTSSYILAVVYMLVHVFCIFINAVVIAKYVYNLYLLAAGE